MSQHNIRGDDITGINPYAPMLTTQRRRTKVDLGLMLLQSIIGAGLFLSVALGWIIITVVERHQ